VINFNSPDIIISSCGDIIAYICHYDEILRKDSHKKNV
jgi:hypothetical protein